MRHYLLLTAGFVLLAAACETGPIDPTLDDGPSFAVSGGVLASVRGSGHIPQGDDDQRLFTFTAQQRVDGSVTGQFTLLITRSVLGSENPSITRIEAEVTCMAVADNLAWVGGVVKNSSNPDWIGRETGWAVEDNGEGAGSFDAISLMNIPGPPGLAQSVCDAQTRNPNTNLENGNIQISTGGPANDVSFPFYAITPVCGDWVQFVGTFHPVFRFSADRSGGFHARGHINATGVGVGLFSGDVYNWNDAINFNDNFQPPQATFTSQQAFLLIGRGTAPNQTLHLIQHVTVTPDGVVNITADNFSFECR